MLFVDRGNWKNSVVVSKQKRSKFGELMGEETVHVCTVEGKEKRWKKKMGGVDGTNNVNSIQLVHSFMFCANAAVGWEICFIDFEK